ncbi:MAG: pyruvate kinase, partial [Planctomycetota bacterium]
MYPRTDKNFSFTKVVATLGPATAREEDLSRLLDTGVDVCRLNFSHGDHDGHLRNLRRIRDWERRHNRPVAVLGDLCGPKIRLTELAGEPFALAAGDEVRIVRGEQPTTREQFCVTYEKLVDEVQPGARIYIDDGLVRLLVIDRDADGLTCTCTTGGVVRSRKGVNLPDTSLSVPALTDKDRADLQWAIDNELDFVALSFVRRPEDVYELRERIDAAGSPLRIIVKIEKSEALEHLDELIAAADGVMVARGDLGVEMDIWRVPLVQKEITRRCRDAAKPVIIATQMLQSMVDNAMPTRAEVSDVANAILDATDAVMLSAESAAGRFPIAAAEVMNLVAQATEQYQRGLPHQLAPESR